MLKVHRWDLGERGKLFMVTEEPQPKGTINLSKGWEGKIKGSPTKVIKILTNAPVTQEIEEETATGTNASSKTATVANVIRAFVENLKEKE